MMTGCHADHGVKIFLTPVNLAGLDDPDDPDDPAGRQLTNNFGMNLTNVREVRYNKNLASHRG
jgi:hypothetical protein